MPTFHAKTTEAETVWKSPDGQRTIYEVTLEVSGQHVKAKTFSAAIARVGFDGDVESYEKQSKMGAETYVKQVQKEGGFQGGGFKPGGRRDSDPFTMYLSYAKDIVVAHVAAQTADGKKLSLEDSIAAALTYGTLLYESRPDAPKKEPEPLPTPPPDDEVTYTNLDDLFPPKS